MSTAASAKPAVFVARRIFPEVIEKLSAQLDVSHNQADERLSPEELIARLQGKQGVFTTGSERIDA
nr:D-glycerate dehydrogenase [Ottowia sp.]